MPSLETAAWPLVGPELVSHPTQAMEFVTEEGEIVRGNFTIMGVTTETGPYAVATTDPVFTGALLRRGPAGLDDLWVPAPTDDNAGRRSVLSVEWSLIAAESNQIPDKAKLTTLSIDANRLLRAAPVSTVRSWRHGNTYDGNGPPAAPDDVQGSSQNLPAATAEELSMGPGCLTLHNQIPSLPIVISQLGIELGKVDDAWYNVNRECTVPLPAEFLWRLGQARIIDHQPGIYYPDIVLTEQSIIGAQEYVSGFAKGVLLISTAELKTFLHDIALDHMTAWLVFGQDLMPLLQTYAQVTLARNSQKVTANATSILDNISLDMGSFELGHTPIQHQPGQDLAINKFDQVVTVLRRAKRLPEIPIVQRLLNSNMVDSSDHVTGCNLAQAFIDEAVDRFNVAIPNWRI